MNVDSSLEAFFLLMLVAPLNSSNYEMYFTADNLENKETKYSIGNFICKMN